jgi:hypothetical protein
MLDYMTKLLKQRLQAFKCQFDESFNLKSHRIAVMLGAVVFFWSI